MIMNEKIQVRDTYAITETFEKAKQRLKDANNLVYEIDRKDVTLDIYVHPKSDKDYLMISLPGLNDVTTSLRCAINEYEDVLKTLESLPEMVGKLKEKWNQPPKR